MNLLTSFNENIIFDLPNNYSMSKISNVFNLKDKEQLNDKGVNIDDQSNQEDIQNYQYNSDEEDMFCKEKVYGINFNA